MPTITSPDNSALRLVRSLARRKGRQSTGLYLAEGERVVADVIAAGVAPHLILIRDDFEPGRPELADVIDDGPYEVRVIMAPLFDATADTVNPQGIMALFPMPESDRLPASASLVALLDGIRDPGNMGTLIRSAAAAGCHAIVTSPGTVDPFAPKVVRSAMGAHVRLPIVPLDDEALDTLRRFPLRAMAEADAQADHDAVDWRQPAVLIVGSEADGPTAVGRELATTTVRIPMGGGVESLNAAVAGSIILFEASRQRRSGSVRATGDAESRGIG